MTVLEMLGQSIILTILGMAVVFSFLALMVIIVNHAGKFIIAKGHDVDTEASVSRGAPVNAARAANGARVTAAISAAVNEYRKTN